MKNRGRFVRAAALYVAILCLFSLASCFDENYKWDLPEREEVSFDLGGLPFLPNEWLNSRVDLPSGVRLTLSEDGSYYTATDGTGCTESDITIPKSYNGIPIEAIGDNAFEGMTSLKSISLPDSIVRVGRYAFEECRNLEYKSEDGYQYLGNKKNPYLVVIGFDVKSQTRDSDLSFNTSTRVIADGAFAALTNIKSVNIHDEIVTVGANAFVRCPSLSELNMGKGVKYIGDYAFYECTNLRSLTLFDSVEKIGDFAFMGCSKIETVELGNSIESIGNYAFNGLAKLESLTIPDSVKTLGEGAFVDCSTLTEVYIGSGLEVLPTAAFKYCTALRTVELPDSVREIGDQAFYNCAYLSKIMLPESIEVIGENAFEVTNLAYTDFNGWCKYLGTDENPYAYLISVERRYVTKTENIILHEDTKVIARKAFTDSLGSDCIIEMRAEEGKYLRVEGNCVIELDSGILVAALPNCSIPDDGSVTAIGDYVFAGKSNVSVKSLPESVKRIGDYAFNNCEDMTDFSCNEGLESIGEYAFSGCQSLTDLDLSDTVKSIGAYAFRYCVSLKEIILPESLTYIGEGTFQYCSTLKTVEIHAELDAIPAYMFADCVCLAKIKLPESVESIGRGAFENCKLLYDIEFGDKLKYIGSYAFYGCRLTSIKLPESVLLVDTAAFATCDKLVSFTVNNGIEKFGDAVFAGCSLSFINYNGTEKEWREIENYKGIFGTGCPLVYFSDGIMTAAPDDGEDDWKYYMDEVWE